jgi:serine/threonine protein kinase
MTLSLGTRFGPYEILSSVGSGGIGEVWKAQDTRLCCIVAIKKLPGNNFVYQRKALASWNRA